MSAYDTPTEDCTAIPAGASVIGTDADGATHHVGNPVTSEGLPVFVEAADGSIETYDLLETPCADCDDPVKGWIHHVRQQRGDWATVTYDASLTTLLATGGRDV